MRQLVSLVTSCLVLAGCAVEQAQVARPAGSARPTPRAAQATTAPVGRLESNQPPRSAAGSDAALSSPAAAEPLAVLPPLPGALRGNADLLGLINLPPEAANQFQTKAVNLSGLDGQAALPGTPLINLDGGSLINLDGGSLINLDGGTYRLRGSDDDPQLGPDGLSSFLDKLPSVCDNPFSPRNRPPLARELALLAIHGPIMRSALAVVQRQGMAQRWYCELPYETPLGLTITTRLRFAPEGAGGKLYVWMKDLTDQRFKHHATVVFENQRKGQIFAQIQVPTIGLVVTKARFGLDEGTFSVELASFPDGQGPKLFELPLTASFWTMRHAIEITRHRTPQPDGTVVSYRSVVTNGSKVAAFKCVDMRRITVARFLADQRGAVCTRRFAEDGLGAGYSVAGDVLATSSTPVAAWYLDDAGQVLPTERVDGPVKGIRFEASDFEEADVPDLAREHNPNVQTMFQVPPPPSDVSP